MRSLDLFPLLLLGNKTTYALCSYEVAVFPVCFATRWIATCSRSPFSKKGNGGTAEYHPQIVDCCVRSHFPIFFPLTHPALSAIALICFVGKPRTLCIAR